MQVRAGGICFKFSPLNSRIVLPDEEEIMKRWIRVLCGYIGSSWQNPDVKWQFTRGESRAVWPSRTMERLSMQGQGWSSESQRPCGVESGEGCEEQQEGLVQVYQQQNESKEKYASSTEWDGEFRDKGCRTGNRCLFALVFTGKCCLQEPQVQPTRGKVWLKGDLPLWVRLKCLDKPDV